jgi:endonuclease/exonuclease/phosphatase family metal-dependent hydrolase
VKNIARIWFGVPSAQIEAPVAVALCLLCLSAAQSAEPETLRVMTFNVCIGGTYLGQPLEQTTRVIQAARADIVGIQEGSAEEREGEHPDNARIIARQLGWNYSSRGDDDTSVMSRYKILGQTPEKWGVQLELPSGRHIWVFNAHFAHAPYQPYQLLRIPYADAPFITTANAAVSEAQKARGKQVAAMLAEIAAIRNQKTPIVVTGDFNEPSSLDWTDGAHGAGRCPLVVRWPTCAAFSMQVSKMPIEKYLPTRIDSRVSRGHLRRPRTTARIDTIASISCSSAARVPASKRRRSQVKRLDLPTSWLLLIRPIIAQSSPQSS